MLTCEPLGQVAVAARQGDRSALLGDRGPGGRGGRRLELGASWKGCGLVPRGGDCGKFVHQST